MQLSTDDATRTYLDYEGMQQAVDGICNMFEQKLKLQNPDSEALQYDVSQIFEFLDKMRDLGVLIYNVNINAYEPKGKAWLKEHIYRGLKQ